MQVSLSPLYRKLAPSAPGASLVLPSCLAQRRGPQQVSGPGMGLGSMGPSVSPSLKWEWQRRPHRAETRLSRAAQAMLSSTSSLLPPSPIAGVPAQSPPEPGCGAGAPLFKRAGKLPRADSQPRVALAAQWSRRLGPAFAARGPSFVCSASPDARGPRPAPWADKAGAAASPKGWRGARTTLLPP